MARLAILIDPDKPAVSLSQRIERLQQMGLTPDLIFLGGSTGSLCSTAIFDEAAALHLPVWLFPGNANQLSARADALLLPIVISGRNAEMLIGRHVAAAQQIQALHIPVYPMGYILIDGGKKTSVQQESQTQPIPPENVSLIVNTALAGEQLGQQYTYLEAGSGATVPVPVEVIKAVRETVHTQLIVGGGLRTKTLVEQAWQAGADIVVIGNALEEINPLSTI